MPSRKSSEASVGRVGQANQNQTQQTAAPAPTVGPVYVAPMVSTRDLTPVQRTGAAVLYAGAAAALGFFSYSLFTAGLGFKETHPVWGTIFGLSALSSAVGAGSTLLGLPKDTVMT